MFTRLTKAEETDPGSSQRRPSRVIRRTTARPSWAWVTSIRGASMGGGVCRGMCGSQSSFGCQCRRGVRITLPCQPTRVVVVSSGAAGRAGQLEKGPLW